MSSDAGMMPCRIMMFILPDGEPGVVLIQRPEAEQLVQLAVPEQGRQVGQEARVRLVQGRAAARRGSAALVRELELVGHELIVEEPL